MKNFTLSKKINKVAALCVCIHVDLSFSPNGNPRPSSAYHLHGGAGLTCRTDTKVISTPSVEIHRLRAFVCAVILIFLSSTLMTLNHQTSGDSHSEVKPDLIVETLPATIEGPNGPIPVIGRDMRGNLMIQLDATTGYQLPPGYSFTMDGLD